MSIDPGGRVAAATELGNVGARLSRVLAGPAADARHMVRRADGAMYSAKPAGKDG